MSKKKLKKSQKGNTGSRTRVVGIKIQSDNHYTISPFDVEAERAYASHVIARMQTKKRKPNFKLQMRMCAKFKNSYYKKQSKKKTEFELKTTSRHLKAV